MPTAPGESRRQTDPSLPLADLPQIGVVESRPPDYGPNRN